MPMGKGENSTNCRNLASLRLSFSSACLRSVTSICTLTIPVIFPWASRSGAVEMIRSIREPSFLWRRTSNSCISPRSARWRKVRCSSYLSGEIWGRNCPTASASLQPSIRSAAGFHRVTIPSGSMAIIATGEAWTNAWSVSVVFRSSSSACLRLVMSITETKTRLKDCSNPGNTDNFTIV